MKNCDDPACTICAEPVNPCAACVLREPTNGTCCGVYRKPVAQFVQSQSYQRPTFALVAFFILGVFVGLLLAHG